jgi:hypothetical protein
MAWARHEHGTGTAWERHGMCELAFTGTNLYQSLSSLCIWKEKTFATYCNIADRIREIGNISQYHVTLLGVYNLFSFCCKYRYFMLYKGQMADSCIDSEQHQYLAHLAEIGQNTAIQQ